MRVQLLVPENTMIKPEIFDRLMSAAPITLVVLAAIPLALGLIAFIVPLQIGARGVALPRLLQLSYWLYLVGGVTIYASFLYQAPESGSAALPPLSDTVFTPTNGTDAWIAGTALATLGFVCFAINLVATLSKLRAPGIAWRRLPLFSWAAAVIGWMLLVIGPMMLAALVMLEVDRRFDGVFFDPGEGGAPLLYEHLSTIFLTGAYLIIFIAAAGAISEILTTFSRKPVFSQRAIAGCFDRDRSDRAVGVDAEHVLGADQRRLHDRGDVLRPGSDRAGRPALLQLDRDDLGRHARAAGGDLVRAGGGLGNGVRPRRRAQLFGDPGGLGARQHDREPRRHALRPRRRWRDRRLRRAALLVSEAQRHPARRRNRQGGADRDGGGPPRLRAGDVPRRPRRASPSTSSSTSRTQAWTATT